MGNQKKISILGRIRNRIRIKMNRIRNNALKGEKLHFMFPNIKGYVRNEEEEKTSAFLLGMEKNACYQRIPAWEIHTQIQSKIQKVAGGFTGGLKRLTSVSGLRVFIFFGMGIFNVFCWRRRSTLKRTEMKTCKF